MQDTGTSERFISVKFSDANTGFAFGGNVGALTGSIYRSNNAGLTWDLSTSIDDLLYRSSFPTTTQGYCCGRNGTVLRIKEILNGVENPTSPVVAENVALIYPNPTKDILQVDLNLVQASQVQATLYDAQGKFHSSLLSTSLASGNHKLVLGNLSAIETGTYTVIITINAKQHISRIIKIWPVYRVHLWDGKTPSLSTGRYCDLKYTSELYFRTLTELRSYARSKW